jgi:hypothetical protein
MFTPKIVLVTILHSIHHIKEFDTSRIMYRLLTLIAPLLAAFPPAYGAPICRPLNSCGKDDIARNAADEFKLK